MRIVAIVEGHGEAEAVPILVRRVDAALNPDRPYLDVPHPIRLPKSRLTKQGELEKAIELAARQTTPEDGILVLLDADQAAPCVLGPELLERARAARPDRRICVVIAKTEYEAWFLAAAESIAGHRTLPDDLTAPEDAEAIRDAKGWLSGNMSSGHSYKETIDQPALTSVFDLRAARGAPSFDKLYRDLTSLLLPAAA